MTRAWAMWGRKLVLSMVCALGAGPLAGCIQPPSTADVVTVRSALTGDFQESGGQVVMEAPRHVMIQDTINHWAHHRGQMTVYLRLMGAKVPALYGPSADDTRFL